MSQMITVVLLYVGRKSPEVLYLYVMAHFCFVLIWKFQQK